MDIKQSLLDFGKNRKGSVAVTFAILALVTTGLIFGVIDVRRAYSVKESLQDATDAATLAAARSPATDAATLQSVGQTYLNNQIKAISLTGVTSKFVLNNTNVVGTASGYMNPIIMGIFFKDAMKIGAEAEVTRELTSTTEVALVLDTTASMAGAKITTLKSAAKDLVQKVMAGGGNQAKVAIVPFANYVNVGVSNKNASFVQLNQAEYVQKVAAACYDNYTTTCKVPGYSYKCTTYSDGVANPNGSCWQSATGCTSVKNGTQTCYPAQTINHTFLGCVGSPAYPKNVQDQDPARKYPGFLDTTCTQEMTPLTSVMGQAVSATQTLSAAGDTYIPAGLAWGWNLLSSAVPITDAAPYDPTGTNKKPRKVLVLMTDGANSMDVNTSNGSHYGIGGAVPTNANKYTAELCANIKAAKIEVFTVAFTITDATAKKMISDCASDGAHYFDAANTADLTAAFQAIGDSLQAIRIVR